MAAISKEVYFVAFLITTGVFLLGLLLGFVIEGKRVMMVQEKDQEQKIAFSSAQLQYQFLQQLQNEKNCPAMFTAFYDNLEDLEETRIRLEKYDRKATLDKKSFELLQREYLLAEVRYWLLASDIKKICDFDVVTALYFYSDEDSCDTCDNQAFVLSYLKDLFGDKLLVFSFNAKIEHEPLIDLLKTAHNVTTYPSVVVDNITYHGFRDKDLLLQDVCLLLKEKTDPCLGQ